MADKSDTEPNITIDSDSDDDSVPPPPQDADSDDEYVPPPPKMRANGDDDDDDEGDDEDDDDDDDDSLASGYDNATKITQADTAAATYVNESDDDLSLDDDSDDDENYLQKFGDNLKSNTIADYHPELLSHNNEEVESLSRVVRNEQGIISDHLHRTFPFITKYERARVLGERAKQLNMGAKPMIEVGPDVIDGYLIALAEFEQKCIPFIIKRPLPNGGCEYWKFRDLELI
jgi:DNA-directed RNA polymerase I, II, and III subunit RPABC2